MEIRHILPVGCPPPHESMQYYGLLGDYVGGFWGTFVAALTAVGVFVTVWYTRRIDYKSKTYQIFAEMLRTHEEIVASLKINDLEGREAISLVLSEFYAIYNTVTETSNAGANWSLRERIDIAYTYTFFGPSLQVIMILNGFKRDQIKQVGDGVASLRDNNDSEKRAYRGHQNRLSQYFRNLFSAYSFIEQSDLSRNEKRSLGKVLRSKLSNYEQALLALNCISHLGKPWVQDALLSTYKPIEDIPENFFSFDREFSLKTQFPKIFD